MRGYREGSQLADGRKSLLAAFQDVGGVMIESQFVVQCQSEVFVAVYNFYCLIVDMGGVPGGSVMDFVGSCRGG